VSPVAFLPQCSDPTFPPFFLFFPPLLLLFLFFSTGCLSSNWDGNGMAEPFWDGRSRVADVFSLLLFFLLPHMFVPLLPLFFLSVGENERSAVSPSAFFPPPRLNMRERILSSFPLFSSPPSSHLFPLLSHWAISRTEPASASDKIHWSAPF